MIQPKDLLAFGQSKAKELELYLQEEGMLKSLSISRKEESFTLTISDQVDFLKIQS